MRKLNGTAIFYTVLVICIIICICNSLIFYHEYKNVNKYLTLELLSIVNSMNDLNSRLDILWITDIENIPEDFRFVDNPRLEYSVTYTKYFTDEGLENLLWMQSVEKKIEVLIEDGRLDKAEQKWIKDLQVYLAKWTKNAEERLASYDENEKGLYRDIRTILQELNDYSDEIEYALYNENDEYLSTNYPHTSEVSNLGDGYFLTGVNLLKHTFEHVLGNPRLSTDGKRLIIKENKNDEFNLYKDYQYYVDESGVNLYEITSYRQEVDKPFLKEGELDSIADKFISRLDNMVLIKRDVRISGDDNSLYGIRYEYVEKKDEIYHHDSFMFIYVDKYGYISGINMSLPNTESPSFLITEKQAMEKLKPNVHVEEIYKVHNNDGCMYIINIINENQRYQVRIDGLDGRIVDHVKSEEIYTTLYKFLSQ